MQCFYFTENEMLKVQSNSWSGAAHNQTQWTTEIKLRVIMIWHSNLKQDKIFTCVWDFSMLIWSTLFEFWVWNWTCWIFL